jgi:hypothetical protein
MMQANYCDDMPIVAKTEDYERMLCITMHRLVPTGSPVEARDALRGLYWHALTLWNEAGRPLPSVFHLGSFVRIGPLLPAEPA